MGSRVTICGLIVGFACPFIPLARGQQSGPVESRTSEGTAENPGSPGGVASESDVATANNPIAPMNALYFQDHFAPAVYGVPGSSNLLDLRTLLVSGRQITRITPPISTGQGSNGNPHMDNKKDLIPMGAGFGKVFETGNVMVNAFIEPQFIVYRNGTGLPSFQIFSGLLFQFRKKAE
jgi:hypothetical protein